MMTKEHFLLMARYNSWSNENLFEACAQLSDGDRKADRGAFFGSVHGTLNHILLADRIWMGRFEGVPYDAGALDVELYADFAALSQARISEDARIADWAAGLDDDRLKGTLSYTSIVRPEPRTYVYWQAVTHFFNHQIHHRGQASTLLAQLGVDYGVTDMIALPGVALG